MMVKVIFNSVYTVIAAAHKKKVVRLSKFNLYVIIFYRYGNVALLFKDSQP